MSGLGGFFFLADTLTPILTHMDPASNAEEMLKDFAPEVQDWARANAPWADDTGAARNGLLADVYRNGDDVVLQLYHTVDYGVWLETIQSGAYAIIMPTLEHFEHDIFRKLGATDQGEDLGDGGFGEDGGGDE